MHSIAQRLVKLHFIIYITKCARARRIGNRCKVAIPSQSHLRGCSFEIAFLLNQRIQLWWAIGQPIRGIGPPFLESLNMSREIFYVWHPALGLGQSLRNQLVLLIDLLNLISSDSNIKRHRSDMRQIPIFIRSSWLSVKYIKKLAIHFFILFLHFSLLYIEYPSLNIFQIVSHFGIVNVIPCVHHWFDIDKIPFRGLLLHVRHELLTVTLLLVLLIWFKQHYNK